MTTLALSQDALTVRVTIIHDLFSARGRRTFYRPVWDSRVGDVLPEEVGDDWVLVLNGGVCSREAELPPGSDLIAYPRVGNDTVKIVTGVIFPPLGVYWGLEAGLNAALGGQWGSLVAGVLNPMGWVAANKVVRPIATMFAGTPGVASIPSGLGSNTESSPTYGFSGIQNEMRAGAVLPVVYGMHRLGGAYIALFVRSGVASSDSQPPGTLEVFPSSNKQLYSGAFTTPISSFVHGTGTNFLSDVAVGQGILCQGYRMTVREVHDNNNMVVEPLDMGGVLPAFSGPYRVIKNTETTGDNDELYALLALSEGEIDSISDVQINGQSALNFRAVTIELALGQNSQNAPTLFGSQTSDTIPASAPITQEWLTYTTTRKNVNAIQIILAAQSLFRTTDQGNLATVDVTFNVEYRLAGNPDFTSFFDFTFSAAKRSPVRRTIHIGDLAPGQYDVRIRRTNPESTELRKVDAFVRTSINEIVNDAYTYPNVAWLALRVLATDQLSGGRPTITALVRGRKVRIFASEHDYTIAWSNNPAWCVLDLMTHHRYGGGAFVAPLKTRTGTVSVTFGNPTVTGVGTNWSDHVLPGHELFIDAHGRVSTVLQVNSDTQLTLTAGYTGTTGSGLPYEIRRADVDRQSFLDWAVFCNAMVSDGHGGTERRAVINLVLDSNGTVLWDALTKMCAVGYATLMKAGNRVKAKFQQAEPSRQLFTMANIARGTFSERFLPLRDRSNYFELQYLDEDNNYTQAVETWQDPLILTNEDSERRTTVSVYGCTRRSQASRLNMFYSLVNRYLTRTIEFAAGLDACVVEPGDVFDFQHDLPQWGFGSRVQAGSTSATVVVDHAMTVESGKTYQVAVQHADGSLERRDVTDGPGVYTTLHVTPAWGTTPVADAVLAFGETNILVKPFRCLSIKRSGSLEVRITGIEYDARIFDETQQGTLIPIQYSVLPSPAAQPSQVTDLRISQIAGGTKLLVSFIAPTDGWYATSYIYRELNGAFSKIGELRTGSLELLGFTYGEIVTIRVAAVSTGGAIANLAQAPAASIVIKSESVPPMVSGLELLGQANNVAFAGRDAKFRWRDRARLSGIGTELLGYETLGVGAGGSDLTFRDYRVEIYHTDGVTLRRREFVVDPSYTYSYEKNYEDGIATGTGVQRAFIAKVSQRDLFNQLSPQPSVITVSNPAPSLLANLRVLPTFSGIIVSFDSSPDIDVEGYKIWASQQPLGTDPALVPSDTVLLYKGKNTYNNLALAPGITYWVRAAAYDSFGDGQVNVNPEISVTPLFLDVDLNLPNGSITAVKIADDAIDSPKIRAGAITADKMTTGQIITVAAQIADAVIGDAHINSIDANKIRAGTVTANKFIDALRGDLSQAIVYVQDILSTGPDFTYQWTRSDLSAVSGNVPVYVNTFLETTLPGEDTVISVLPIRRWDDGLPWWDQPDVRWDEPILSGFENIFQTPILDMLSDRTGRLEARNLWAIENTSTATLVVEGIYRRDGGTEFGSNEPDFDDHTWEPLTPSGTVAGEKNRYVGLIRTGVREAIIRYRFSTSNGDDRIQVINPEVVFNDTRIAPESLNVPVAATASAGGGVAVPATVAGFLVFKTPTGAVAKVPFFNA